jgi:serine O-acetyltransferase
LSLYFVIFLLLYSMNNQIKSLYLKKYYNQKSHICVPGIKAWLEELLVILFPVMGQMYFDSPESLAQAIGENRKRLVTILECQTHDTDICLEKKADKIYQDIFEVEQALNIDVDFFLESDPATSDPNEVVSSYPGFYAIACYRIANKISKMKYPLIARMIAETAHQKTGVDIHPAATIGSPIFIDHATGIVIGQTTVIGDRVSLYQGVTLGALNVNKKLEGLKRHPTVEDDCILYANATILGGQTVIGKGSVVGGNVWLAKSIPAGSSVFNNSSIKIKT